MSTSKQLNAEEALALKKFLIAVFLTVVLEAAIIYGGVSVFLWVDDEWKGVVAGVLPAIGMIGVVWLKKTGRMPLQSTFINAYLTYVVEKVLKTAFKWARSLSALILIAGTYVFIIFHQESIAGWQWHIESYKDVRSRVSEIVGLLNVWPGGDKWPYMLLLAIMVAFPILKRLVPLISKNSGVTIGTLFLGLFMLTNSPPMASTEESYTRTMFYLITPIAILIYPWIFKFRSDGNSNRKFIANYISRDFEPKNKSGIRTMEGRLRNIIRELFSIQKKEFDNELRDLYETFLLWSKRREEADRITADNIRYVDDSPIRWVDEDELGNRRIAYDLFKHIRSSNLDEAKGSVIIGLDGKRGSGKTSIINMLRNDYVQFTAGDISLMRFMAWAYPSGNMIDAFLSDFAKHCESQGIGIGHELEKYSKALSGAHWGFQVAETLSGGKTVAEKIEKISYELTTAKSKTVVVLDDLDRISNLEDLEAILKLLRSAADFPGVIYIVCYSYDDMVVRGEEWRHILSDFQEKFLNWKLKASSYRLSEKSVLSDFLDNRLKSEVQSLFASLINKKSGHLRDGWDRIRGSLEPSNEWKSPDRRDDFADLCESDPKEIFETYIMSAVQQHVLDLKGNQESVTPRFVKSFINETLRMLSDTGTVMELFFEDMDTIQRESSNSTETRDNPVYTEINVHGINSLYMLLRRSFQENKVR